MAGLCHMKTQGHLQDLDPIPSKKCWRVKLSLINYMQMIIFQLLEESVIYLNSSSLWKAVKTVALDFITCYNKIKMRILENTWTFHTLEHKIFLVQVWQLQETFFTKTQS